MSNNAPAKVRDPILNFFMAISILVVAAGVLGIFNMNNSIIRMDERMGHVEYRLVRIEQHHEDNLSER